MQYNGNKRDKSQQGENDSKVMLKLSHYTEILTLGIQAEGPQMWQ